MKRKQFDHATILRGKYYDYCPEQNTATLRLRIQWKIYPMLPDKSYFIGVD